MKNAKKTVVTPLVNPTVVASQMTGCVSTRPNKNGDATVVAFQMLLGQAATAGFDEEESVEERTPSGKIVRSKVPTGKKVEWTECGILIFDEPIEVDGALYWVSCTKRKVNGKGRALPALVLKPLRDSEPEAKGTMEGLSF